MTAYTKPTKLYRLILHIYICLKAMFLCFCTPFSGSGAAAFKMGNTFPHIFWPLLKGGF